ncbi:hypothetical protein Btru_042147 [Bulinus truncatus]|nr:hypothetical protein Btru_042147 [Bulinus truncatus]
MNCFDLVKITECHNRAKHFNRSSSSKGQHNTMNRTDEFVILQSAHWNLSTTEFSTSYVNNVTAVYEVTTPTIPKMIEAMEHYGVPAICVLGIIGDVLSFLVFVCTSFRYQPCSQYLAALAFVDTLFLVSKLLITSVNLLPLTTLLSGYCSVIIYVSYVCSFLSAWFVVLMMTERNIVVCYPFRASSLCSRKKSFIVISLTTLFSLIMYSHSFFTTVNEHGFCVVDNTYFDFLSYFTYVDALLVFVVPFFSVVSLNLKIIYTVRRFRKHHGLHNHNIRRCQRGISAVNTLSLAQVRSTKMLVWVSSVFILLYMSSYLVRLCGLLLENYINNSNSHFYVTQSVCQFLYYLKFCIDFIVYLMTSNNFRQNFARCVTSVQITEHGCRYRYR